MTAMPTRSLLSGIRPPLSGLSEPRTSGLRPLRANEVARHDVRLVVIDRAGRTPASVEPFLGLAAHLREGDLVVVNDAATLPASLRGQTRPTLARNDLHLPGERFELRLSAPVEGTMLTGVLLDDGDHRTRTEHRQAPPVLRAGQLVTIAGLPGRVASADGRRVRIDIDATEDTLWRALYDGGKPIQYAHRPELLPLYEVQTAYAARPWAVEMPSAGRPLTWDVLLALKRRGVRLATLTHAAGLSSTGEPDLDRALPWPERYEIPPSTALAVSETRTRGGRVIAIGTTVVRALEASGGVSGPGVATNRLDPSSRLRVVDGLVSGLHVPGESHFDLLRAFAGERTLRNALELAADHDLSAHELGDSCLLL